MKDNLALGPDTPIVNASLARQAHRHIKDLLVLGRLEPGRSIAFREAAEQLGMSVTPVREALLQLVAQRALLADGRRSIAVPQLSRGHCLEVWDVRMLLEPRCAALATANMTPALIRQLTTLQDRMMAAKQRKDFASGILYNRDFHFVLYTAAATPLLTWMIECVWAQAGMYVQHFHRHHIGDRSGREVQGPHVHTTIVKALQAGNADMVQRGIERDLIEIRDGILPLLEPVATEDGLADGLPTARQV